MKTISNKELLEIIGGINITASFISAIGKGINSILELGRSFGTSIRRIIGNNICPL